VNLPFAFPFSIYQAAGAQQRFAPDSFDHVLGSVVPVQHGGKVLAYGRLVSAEVQDAGHGVLLTFEEVIDPEDDEHGHEAL
jgi:hypothetical protein